MQELLECAALLMSKLFAMRCISELGIYLLDLSQQSLSCRDIVLVVLQTAVDYQHQVFRFISKHCRID